MLSCKQLLEPQVTVFLLPGAHTWPEDRAQQDAAAAGAVAHVGGAEPDIGGDQDAREV